MFFILIKFDNILDFILFKIFKLFYKNLKINKIL